MTDKQTRIIQWTINLPMEKPWEYEDKIECIEVELREVKVKKWMPIED